MIRIAETRIALLPALIEYLKPSQVNLFGLALRSKLLSNDSSLAKGYLKTDGDSIPPIDGLFIRYSPKENRFDAVTVLTMAGWPRDSALTG